MLIKTVFGDYELKFKPKAARALEAATVQALQERHEPTGEEILAEYDKLAGLIHKDGVKVETGNFWDFESKCAKFTKEAADDEDHTTTPEVEPKKKSTKDLSINNRNNFVVDHVKRVYATSEHRHGSAAALCGIERPAQ